ncbi:hypothetical protein BG011_002225, partial [Mortierella polycephala]
MGAINSIAINETFKDFFLSAESVALVDEASGDESDDSSDRDYSPENSNPRTLVPDIS